MDQVGAMSPVVKFILSPEGEEVKLPPAILNVGVKEIDGSTFLQLPEFVYVIVGVSCSRISIDKLEVAEQSTNEYSMISFPGVEVSGIILPEVESIVKPEGAAVNEPPASVIV